MIDRLLAFLSDPRVPLLALALLPVLRAVYAIISRVVKPYPRARAAVEAVAALFPDLVRAVLQGVSIFTGRPAPKLDIVPVGDPDPRVIAAGARAVDIIAGEWRERALAAESRVAELTASDEPGRLRPTVVPGEASPVATTQRHRIGTRPDESGRAQLWTLALVMLGGVVVLAACPKLPPVSGCEPLSQRCEGDRPQVCSPSRRLHFVGDERCDASPGQRCEVRNAVAGCTR